MNKNASPIEHSVRASLEARAGRLAREGVLPIGLIGQQVQSQLVEALVPDAPRCELFGREAWPGADVWGNQTATFSEAANG